MSALSQWQIKCDPNALFVYPVNKNAAAGYIQKRNVCMQEMCTIDN